MSIRNTEKEGVKGRVTDDKKRKKGRRVADVVRREKMERERSFETNTLGGNRCLRATLETEW